MHLIQKFLKKDNIKVLLGNLAASFFGLVNFMLMVRILNKNEFGLVVIFFSAAGLADLIRTGFIRQGLVRHWVMNIHTNKSRLIGSAWLLHIIIGFLIALISYVLLFVFQFISVKNMELHLLISYYPFILLSSLPHQMESWLCQAKKDYAPMNIFRLAVNMLFFLALMSQYKSNISTEHILQWLIICNGLVSVYALFKYASIKYIVRAKMSYIRSLFNFGKYSLTTLAGSNLLKSTDTLLIGMLINSEQAAIYAIPFKVIEFLEIPLRGFVMTSFNQLTYLFENKNPVGYSKHFQGNILKLTLAFLPIIFACLLFPTFVIHFIGGDKYEESILILQVLSLAMILLPADKFVGVGLDSINQPQTNASKVWGMVLINFIGDFIIISLNGPLWMVAMITIANISFGILYGVIKNSFLKLSLRIPSVAVLKF